jgi:hypothetical protein
LVITQEVVQMAGGLTYILGKMEASRGEEWSSKGTNKYPLTFFALEMFDNIYYFLLHFNHF